MLVISNKQLQGGSILIAEMLVKNNFKKNILIAEILAKAISRRQFSYC